jgi:SET domain-containing protein
MSNELREFFHHYAYLSAKSGRYILHADNARFINHAPDANLRSVKSIGKDEDIDIAARDIRAGEELTADYWQFDLDAPLKLESKPHEAPPLAQAA